MANKKADDIRTARDLLSSHFSGDMLDDVFRALDGKASTLMPSHLVQGTALVYQGTALVYFAKLPSSRAVVTWLLENGADPNAQEGIHGASALHVANAEIAYLLIERGAKVDLPNRRGETPLAHAASRKDFEKCKVLLGAGADPAGGLAAAAIAGDRDILSLLLDASPGLQALETKQVAAALSRHPELQDIVDVAYQRAHGQTYAAKAKEFLAQSPSKLRPR